jgi:actin-related protein
LFNPSLFQFEKEEKEGKSQLAIQEMIQQTLGMYDAQTRDQLYHNIVVVGGTNNDFISLI